MNSTKQILPLPLSSSLPLFMWPLSPILWVRFQGCTYADLAPIKHLPIANPTLVFNCCLAVGGKVHHFYYLHVYKYLITPQHHFLPRFFLLLTKISVISHCQLDKLNFLPSTQGPPQMFP